MMWVVLLTMIGITLMALILLRFFELFEGLDEVIVVRFQKNIRRYIALSSYDENLVDR